MRIYRRAPVRDHGWKERVDNDLEDIEVTFFPKDQNDPNLVSFELAGDDALFSVHLTGEEVILAFLTLPPEDIAAYLAKAKVELQKRLSDPKLKELLEPICIENLYEPAIAVLRAGLSS